MNRYSILDTRQSTVDSRQSYLSNQVITSVNNDRRMLNRSNWKRPSFRPNHRQKTTSRIDRVKMKNGETTRRKERGTWWSIRSERRERKERDGLLDDDDDDDDFSICNSFVDDWFFTLQPTNDGAWLAMFHDKGQKKAKEEKTGEKTKNSAVWWWRMDFSFVFWRRHETRRTTASKEAHSPHSPHSRTAAHTAHCTLHTVHCTLHWDTDTPGTKVQRHRHDDETRRDETLDLLARDTHTHTHTQTHGETESRFEFVGQKVQSIRQK